MKILIGFLYTLLALGISGCVTFPQQQVSHSSEKSKQDRKLSSPVEFKLHPGYQTRPPDCIAILPLEKAIKPGTKSKPKMTEKQVEEIRRVLYSHMSPARFRDVELASVDKVMSQLYSDEYSDYKKIAHSLDCDNLIVGVITDYSMEFYGVYSQISVGAELKLISAIDNQILWEGKYIAKSHETAIPLSPLGVAKSIYDTTTHLSAEEILKVSDDLARQLVSTIPEPQPLKNLITPYSVIAASLNIRSGPGRSYNRTGILRNSDRIMLVENTNSAPWLKIKTPDGKEGYVHQKYVVAVESTF